MDAEKQEIKCPNCGQVIWVYVKTTRTVVPGPPPGPIRARKLCPVCGGKGTVPAGFYSFSVAAEMCRACGGSGVV